MWILLAFVLSLFLGTEAFAQSDVLLNLQDPAETLKSGLRVVGAFDNTANPTTVKVPTLPCVANAAAPTWTENSIVPCSVTLAGEIRMSGGGSGGTSSLFGAAFPASGTAAGYFDGTNMQGARVHDLDSGGGAEYNLGSAVRCTASGGSTACLPPTATSADAIVDQVATFIHGLSYMYNGATWDRIRGTIATGLLVDVSDAFLLDATFTGRFPAGSTPADNESNAVTISRIGNFNYIFDGATWDRWTGAVTQAGTWNINNISGTISLPTGAATEATLATRLSDATFTGRFPVAYLDADAIANQTTTAVHGQSYFYNGTTWDRMRGTVAGGLLVDVSDAFVLDTTVTNRFPAGSTPADNESNAVTISRLGTFNYIFDGAAWDRWNGSVSQAGTWNIGTLTTITNPVTVTGGTTASANIDGTCPSGAANFTVAASNGSRTWLALWASPANTDDVFIKLGATATSADARIAPGQPINITAGRIYTGIIDAFPASGTQAVCVMELN